MTSTPQTKPHRNPQAISTHEETPAKSMSWVAVAHACGPFLKLSHRCDTHAGRKRGSTPPAEVRRHRARPRRPRRLDRHSSPVRAVTRFPDVVEVDVSKWATPGGQKRAAGLGTSLAVRSASVLQHCASSLAIPTAMSARKGKVGQAQEMPQTLMREGRLMVSLRLRLLSGNKELTATHAILDLDQQFSRANRHD